MTVRQAELTVFLGLGGNLGDPQATFVRTRAALQADPRILECVASPLYRTPALGGPPDQPDYLNAVLGLQTDLAPQELLDLCQDLEQTEGRKRTERWGPRILDIDLLLYADQVICEKGLCIPHPRLHERLFVLCPLADLAPDIYHPLLQLEIKTLLARLPSDPQIQLINPNW